MGKCLGQSENVQDDCPENVVETCLIVYAEWNLGCPLVVFCKVTDLNTIRLNIPEFCE